MVFMKERIIKFINFIIKICFVFSFFAILFCLLKIDILPNKYLLLFSIFFSLVLLYNFLSDFIFKKSIHKFISIIISFILIIINLFIYIYINKTDNFVNSLQNNDVSETYYLAVLSNSKYKSIDDLNNLNIGTIYSNEDSYDSITKIMKKTINYNEVKYNDLIEMCNDLIVDKINAILISEDYKKFLEENNELIDIQLKFIYDVTTKTSINIRAKDLNVVDTPFIVYITGIDTYGDISSVARSDVNIVAVVNPKIKKILLITIPRDYYVQLHNTAGYKDKLTHAGMYGIDMSINTIEDLLNIDINYYVRLNFSTLINAVDTIGGIDVYSEYEFNTYGYQFYKGFNSINGDYALAFSRARYNFLEGDRTRGENQMRVIEAIISKMSSSRILINNYLSILDGLKNTFQTNIDSSRIYDLVKMQLSTMPAWNIEKFSLNGYDSSNYTYSMGDMILYVMEPDYSTIDMAKTKIKEMMQ